MNLRGLTSGAYWQARRLRGFSLVELMLAFTVLGIVAAIAYPMYADHREAIKRQQAISDIRSMENAVQRFYGATMRLPDTLADIGKADLKDPWGFAYEYTNLADSQQSHGKAKARKDRNLVPINTDFDLYSVGPDGRSVAPLTAQASRDDIVRANNGAFVGLAVDY